MSCRYFYKGKIYNDYEFNDLLTEEFDYKSPKNLFLQLLNKDNSWVTFMVKAIIQDSSRRGYEKVLFPAGDTAAKIEGHETLEQFIQGRQARIDVLEKRIAKGDIRYIVGIKEGGVEKSGFNSREDAEDYIKYNKLDTNHYYIEPQESIEHFKNELAQYEREIEDATAGRTKFAAINNFYENTIQNILKKQGYNPNRTTDEYGNDWFEVDSTDKNKTIYFNRITTPENLEEKILKHLQDSKLINIKKEKIRGHEEWVVKRTASGGEFNTHTGAAEDVLVPNLRKISDWNEEVFNEYGFRPIALIKSSDRTYVVKVNRQEAVFSRNASGTAIAHSVMQNMAEALKAKTGVDYNFITADEARQLTEGTKIPYGGESAFYYPGKGVYFVQDRMDLNDAFHEFAHPFVSALRLNNKDLYDKIYSDIENSKDPAIHAIVDQVFKNYSDFDTKDPALSGALGDEIIVHILTDIGQGKLSLDNRGWLQKIVDKILFYTKQLLRSIFGLQVDIQGLELNTTLDQLSDILYKGENKINLNKSDDNGFVMFNRDMARELADIDNHAIVKSIDTFRNVLTDHVNKLYNNRNYEALRDVLKNQYDGSLLNDANKLLKLAQEFENDINKQFAKLRNFSQAIIGVRIASEKMKSHVDELIKSDEASEKDKLRALQYYSYMLNDWKEVFEQLRRANKNDFPLLASEIEKATSNFKRIEDHTDEIYKKGALAVLRKELAPIKEYIDATYPAKIAELEKELAAGNKSVASRLNTMREEYKRFNYTDETILKYLRGEMGDTNAFSSLLESYTSSPDPVIGGFATYLNKALYEVEAWVQSFSTDMRKELDPLYKKLGVDRSDPAMLGRMLTFNNTVFTKDENNNPKGHNVKELLNEFSNGWMFDYKNFEHKIAEASLGSDKEKEIQLRRDFNEHKARYFHREYKDEVYEAKRFWWSSDVAQKAYQKRKEITDLLKSFEAYDSIDNEDIEEIDRLNKQLRTLSSTKNLDGSDKTGEDLDIAKAIQEYQKLNKGLYDEYEIKGSFERSKEQFEEDMMDKGFDPASPQYKKELNGWIKQNIRVQLSDQFYNDRQAITDEIDSITSKISDSDEAKKIQIGKYWKDIIEQVKGFRDQNGQPIGTQLEQDKVKQIYKDQEKINEMKDALMRMNGLTRQEQEELEGFYAMFSSGLVLSVSEQERFNELNTKKQIRGLSQADKNRLNGLFQQLQDLQSKIPTEYYLETLNEKLLQAGINQTVDFTNVDSFLNKQSMDKLLESSGNFKSWFLANHIEKTKWNAEAQSQEDVYERLYIWNRIIPNDLKLKEALQNNDYQALLKVDTPYVKIKKANKFYFYRIKNEHYTPKVVGNTVDNRGNWLPKTVADGAADDKYENKKFFEMKNAKSPTEQDLFKTLEVYKKYLLSAQDGSVRYGRLYLEVPRMRKESIENLNNLTSNPGGAIKNMLHLVKDRLSFKSKADDFDVNLAGTPNEAKMYVMTDLFGNEISSIPVKYMSKLEADDISLDLGRTITKYASSLRTNKALHDINPIARALQKVIQEEGIKDVNKMSSKNAFSKLTNLIGVRSNENTRLKTLNNMLERDLEGIENKMELGVFGNRVAQHLMKLAAFGSLALNIPAGVKNLAAARIQGALETITGENYTLKEWTNASGVFVSRFIPRLMRDYNKLANKSLESQMMELFDPVQGTYGERLGHEFAGSVKRDLSNLHFTTSPQKFGEIEAQGTTMVALLMHQRVTMLKDGVETKIPYFDAWEVRDGKIQLKEGVDKSYAPGGEGFTTFKLKQHKVNELLQGAYAKSNQPEINRYTIGRMTTFMRRYFIPGAVNRFATRRPNVALGTLREGYYVSAVHVSMEMLKSGMKNWHLFSPVEKQNFWKTLTEMGYSMMFLGLLALCGYNDDDKDRFKKIKNNDWAMNMFIYEMLMIKGEAETFIPIPGMGVNELLRIKDSPSIAFPLINKYYKVFSHLYDAITDPFVQGDQLHYQKATGIYKEGDLKLLGDLNRIIGYSGATVHPDVAIKNYSITMNKYR